MTIFESFNVAWRGLTANKLRALLTMLGMIIGVASVIAVMSIGRGTTSAVTAQVAAQGSNLVYVRPGSQTQGGVRSAQGSAVTLTLADANAILESGQAPAVALVAPEFGTNAQVIAGGNNMNTRVLGVNQSYDVVRNYVVEQGEFISEQNMTSRSLVAVLGADVANTLFPNGDALGQNLRINNQTFKVIGILKSKGSTGFGSQDDQVLAPLTTVQSRLITQRSGGGGQQVSTINVQVVSAKEIDNAKAQITALLQERHRITGENDFTVTSQEDTLAALNSVSSVMTMFLGAIAAISLVVGGIGIMNIMLVSVTERTREIGIRKAIGATREDILMQFLTEATVISVAGGGIGVGLGMLISWVLPRFSVGGQALTTVLSPDVALMSMTVSAGIGLFFGIYPAMSAARMHPIQALRHE
ncbi:MAG: ABC transporter permease [Chloroflexi bacterium]|nr:ABC transporter permease [Chloroflexota bacterium]